MKEQQSFTILAAFAVTALLLSFTGRETAAVWGRIDEHTALSTPEGWPQPVYDFEKNPLTPGGFELGRRLFFETGLSGDGTISCASCHLQYTNNTHTDHALSHGIGGKPGTRNTLAIVNVAWNRSFMWDGSINHIEVQPLGPIENPVEMNNTLKNVVAFLDKSEAYRELFKKAFGPKAKVTGQLTLKALAQYMLSLQSGNAKYDRVLRGEKGLSFTPAEQHGLELFRLQCASCHTEPLFTNNGFANNGLLPDQELNDAGRMKATGNREDSLQFRVPTLRNIEVSYPYMHDGRYRNLQMVLFHYSEGGRNGHNVAAGLEQPLHLSETEKRDLIAFLKTLTDTEFLRNPAFRDPAAPPLQTTKLVNNRKP
jgi:cytochrome c peroxidase